MTRRERLLVIAVGSIGILLLWYFYLFAPLRAENRRLNEELATKRRQLAQMEETARQITQLEQEYARLQTFIAEIEAQLPAEKETPTLLVQLERLARAVGVDLQSVRPSPLQAGAAAQVAGTRPPSQQAPPPPPAQVAYQRYPIGLSIRATFTDIIELTSRLNNFPRLIIVRKLQLQPRGGAATEVPELNVTLDVETFILPRGAR